MKLFAALYAADYTTRKLPLMGSFKQGFAPMAAVILFVGFLLLKEPDFGAFVVITAIAFGVLFLGGINVRLFVLLAIVATIGFVLLITFSEYRRQRILGFMDPWQDAYGKGYQLSHALIAFGRGEWFGVGWAAASRSSSTCPKPTPTSCWR
jgi:cell division protein FtsW